MPRKSPRNKKPAIERFWTKVEKYDGCWQWKASKNRDGYGKFSINRNDWVLAHRFSWELHYGPIPEGLKVLHKCDNPECTNPDHLFIGTNLDNSRDCIQKGRFTHKGELHFNSKFTEDQIIEIRKRYENREFQRIIAKDFGTTQAQISQIVLRKQWRHVK